MGRSHTSYDEIDPPAAMRADAEAARQVLLGDRMSRAAASGPPSLDYDDYPREVGKRDLTVDVAAARLAAALNLYLD